VKADGLAAGKGVWVCLTQEELEAGLRAAEALGQPFHVEELLEGEEVSIFALCDGSKALPLPAAQDYKRIHDNDEGANTGGMGSYSPVPRLDDDEVAELVALTCTPVLEELARRSMPFIGVLFAGLMRPVTGLASSSTTAASRRPRDAVAAAAARGACLRPSQPARSAIWRARRYRRRRRRR
jgi:phosphoribosylamine--glycine ligase